MTAAFDRINSPAIAIKPSSFNQAQPVLDPFDPTVHTIDTRREARILQFEQAQAVLDLPDVLAKAIHAASDMTQMFEHDIVDISHDAPRSKADGTTIP
jgi:hypothetical protein